MYKEILFRRAPTHTPKKSLSTHPDVRSPVRPKKGGEKFVIKSGPTGVTLKQTYAHEPNPNSIENLESANYVGGSSSLKGRNPPT
jgi:hypothetical protein